MRQSIRYGRELLCISKNLGNRKLEAHAKAMSHNQVGDSEQGRKYGKELLRISEELGDKELKSKACGFPGWLDSELAEHE